MKYICRTCENEDVKDAGSCVLDTGSSLDVDAPKNCINRLVLADWEKFAIQCSKVCLPTIGNPCVKECVFYPTHHP